MLSWAVPSDPDIIGYRFRLKGSRESDWGWVARSQGMVAAPHPVAWPDQRKPLPGAVACGKRSGLGTAERDGGESVGTGVVTWRRWSGEELSPVLSTDGDR